MSKPKTWRVPRSGTLTHLRVIDGTGKHLAARLVVTKPRNNLEPLCHELATRMYHTLLRSMTPARHPIKLDSTEWPDYAVGEMCKTAEAFLRPRVRVLKKKR